MKSAPQRDPDAELVAPRVMAQTDRAALEARSRRAGLVTTEPSKTIQGPAHDADINTIAKNFGLFGKNLPIPPAIFDPDNYADLSEVPDLQTALNLVREANEQFGRLPADLRSMFNHDPAALWDFVQNPANADQAVELGLLSRRTPIVDPSPLAPLTNGNPPAA